MREEVFLSNERLHTTTKRSETNRPGPKIRSRRHGRKNWTSGRSKEEWRGSHWRRLRGWSFLVPGTLAPEGDETSDPKRANLRRTLSGRDPVRLFFSNGLGQSRSRFRHRDAGNENEMRAQQTWHGGPGFALQSANTDLLSASI